MKAIQTRYKGYHFRSRLEARWAVYFDAICTNWTYEPEGFLCGRLYNEPPKPYLPDFFLSKSETWVEVKPVASLLDFEFLEAMLDYDSDLPGIKDSLGTNRGFVILGDIPEYKKGHFSIHPIIQHSKGLFVRGCYLTPDGVRVIDDGLPIQSFSDSHDFEKQITHMIKGNLKCHHSWWDETDFTFWEQIASEKARSARFEHGETPL